jgi:hypothetical protein
VVVLAVENEDETFAMTGIAIAYIYICSGGKMLHGLVTTNSPAWTSWDACLTRDMACGS